MCVRAPEVSSQQSAKANDPDATQGPLPDSDGVGRGRFFYTDHGALCIGWTEGDSVSRVGAGGGPPVDGGCAQWFGGELHTRAPPALRVRGEPSARAVHPYVQACIRLQVA
jgi:hypothetical protein